MAAFRPTMLTAEMLAERWLVHPSTVYRMLARGELPCRKVGRLVRIPLAHVERLELEAPCRAVIEDITSALTDDPVDTKSPGPSRVAVFDPGARAARIALSLRKS